MEVCFVDAEDHHGLPADAMKPQVGQEDCS